MTEQPISSEQNFKDSSETIQISPQDMAKAVAEVNFDNTEIAFASKNDSQLRKQYWLFSMMNNPSLVSIGTSLVKMAFSLHLPVKTIVKHTVFEHFCGGENIADCENTIRSLSHQHVGTILDYSVEGAENDESFDHTEKEIIATIHKASHSSDIPFSVFKVTGLATVDLLAKVQEKKPLSDIEKQAFAKVRHRVDNICKTAYQKKVKILIDAEETWIQDVIDELAYEMMEKYNKEQPIVYNTYQMYVAKKLEQLKEAYYHASMKNYFLGVKIVRGAYMEKERERAKKMGYPDPIQPNKEATDRDFDAGLHFCVQNHKRIAICAGTHNEYSSYLLTVLMEKYKIPKNHPHFHFAQLYGMSDHISYNLSAKGYNVAKYVPYGPVEKVMPYLIRRAEENTSVAGQSSREFSLVQKEVNRRKKS
ncbi:MAG: proline dehydrogenase family protein [Flammeovirgaceae bacterium]